MSMELDIRCMFNINIHVFVLGISKNKLQVKTKTKNKIRTSSLCDNYIVFQKENLSNLPTSYIISFLSLISNFFNKKKSYTMLRVESV